MAERKKTPPGPNSRRAPTQGDSLANKINKAPPYPNQMPGPAMAKMIKKRFGIS